MNPPTQTRPKPEDYGYEPRNSTGEHGEGGWCIEGGQEAYDEAVAQWEAENQTQTTP